MWLRDIWKWYNDVAHRAIIGSDPKSKNVLRPGSCGASYFQQTCQEYDRLAAYLPPAEFSSPPVPNHLGDESGATYRAHVAALRNALTEKFAADALTWDDLYGFQLALLPLYPPEELRTKRAALKDYFYKLASQHSIESYERTSPPGLSGQVQYDAALADAIFLQTEIAKIETYRPHQEFKRNRITLDLFVSLGITLLFYAFLGICAVVVLLFCQHALPVVFPCIIIAMMLGALGAVVSSQRRLQTSFDQDASILNTTRYVASGLGTRLTPVLGSIFAGVLIVLIYSGLFRTAASLIVPATQQIPPEMQRASGVDSRTFLEFIVRGPNDLVEYAKIIVYAFLAGFAERLVPDTLDRLAMNGSK
jgi:hypothetical protein